MIRSLVACGAVDASAVIRDCDGRTALLDYSLQSVKTGHVEFACNPRETQYNLLGTVPGSVVTTVLDSAMGCAIHSLLVAGQTYTTLELKVNFVHAITVDSGPLIVTGDAIHLGRRTATAERRLADASGRMPAHATTTCLVMSSDTNPASG